MAISNTAKLELFPRPDETIEGVAAELRSKKRTCVDVLECCLARIDALEAEYRAWVLVDREGAREQAKQLDAEIAAGRYRGPLHGIPIGIKDIVDVAGFPTAAGSKARANEIANTDAPVVARLRDAGAVILGKTVTTQFACFDPPVTRNPWNQDRTPGGSSSGSAAAVALGMCLGTIGSQTGGSITRPASYCGILGCKPSYGRVSLDGIVPLAKHLDHPGPMARSVRGLAILLDAISDVDAISGSSSTFSATETKTSAPPRIGRLHGLFDGKAESSAHLAVDRALEALRLAGATVVDATLPATFDDVLRAHRVVISAETAEVHRQRFAEMPEDYLPKVRELIEEGLRVPSNEYERCRRFQDQLKREIVGSFAGVDVLVCPATTGPAPDTSTTGDPAMNSPWSFTGLPTICLPVALSEEGLPLGIQIVGRHAGEAELFRAAAWCEGVIAAGESSR